MWKKLQSKFDPTYIMESQRVKHVYATSIINKWDVVAEDGTMHRVSTPNDIKKYKGSDYWILRTPGTNADYRVLPGYELAANWQTYNEPLPTGAATPVTFSAWREYYHKNNPNQRVVVQDIYKISHIEGSNTYRVEGVDGVIYTVPALPNSDDYSLEHCKLVKSTHPNGNFYYSLLPGSSFATFYRPVDDDPQPTDEPEVAHVKPSEPDPEDVLFPNNADTGTMLLPVNQTLQFVTIFSAALSALIQTRDPNNYNPRDLVKCAYEYAKLSTEKLCGSK